MMHKIRQDDKVQQAEIQTMQLKLESRMKIQEDTAKSLHGQVKIRLCSNFFYW